MKFWDASAIVPLLANEPIRPRMLEILDDDPQALIWWGTPVEIASALARLERDQLLSASEYVAALDTARRLTESWQEIVPFDAVRRTAERLLRIHPLRAADHEPANLELVCLDPG